MAQSPGLGRGDRAQARPFSAYDKAPLDERALWTRTVARTAGKYGFAWAYWQFASDFVLYDFKKEAFVRPILEALVPPRH